MNDCQALVKVDDLRTLGGVLAKSGYFQDAKEEAQAVVKVLAGQELGLGPIASMTGIYIVKGRVTLSANLIGATIKRSGRYDYQVVKLDNRGCTLKFFERNGTSKIELGESTFTDDDAKAAGLGGDNWTKFRRNMHFARAMSNGAKWYCPDVFAGPIYTPEELGAHVDGETGEIIDAEVVTQPEPDRPSPSPSPAPQNGKGKVLEPDALLKALRDKAARHAEETGDAPISPMQVKTLAAAMSKLEPDDQRRHTFLAAAFGVSSTHDLKACQALALSDWMAMQGWEATRAQAADELARVVNREIQAQSTGPLPGLEA